MASVRVAADPRQQFTQYEIDELLSRISSGASCNAVHAIMASGAARHLAVRLLTGDAVADSARPAHSDSSRVSLVDGARPHSAAAGGRRASTRANMTARTAGPVPQSTSWEGPSAATPSPRYSHTPRSPASRAVPSRSEEPADHCASDSARWAHQDAASPRSCRSRAGPPSTVQRTRSETPQSTASPRRGTTSGISSPGVSGGESASRRKLPGRSFSDQPERPRSSGRVDGGAVRCSGGAESSGPGLISPLDLRRRVVPERSESPSGAARAAQGEGGRTDDLRRNVLEKSLSDRPERPMSAAGRCSSSGNGRRLSSGLGRQTVGDELGRKGKEADVWAVCDRLMVENQTQLRASGAGSPRRETEGEQIRSGSKEVRRGEARGPGAHGECCRETERLTLQVAELARANAQLSEMLQIRAGEVQRAEEALRVAQGERDALAQEMEAALHTWMATTPRAAAPSKTATRDTAADVTKASVTIEEHAAVVGRVAAVERENQELWAMLEGLSAQREAELRQTEGLRLRVKGLVAAAASSATTGRDGGGSTISGGSSSDRHGSNMLSVNGAPSASRVRGHRHQSSLHSVHSVPNPVTELSSSPVTPRRRFPSSASVPGSRHHDQNRSINAQRMVSEGSTQLSVGSKKKVWFGQD
ncbi:hypothetical protein CLOM_g15395 [Closterium sp. NIES-68]|nr:hypothetical protein CLOM_g15395 [Closterium sp. NIES-68]GJP65677.1 hypothetical protein CLOP_g22543 [Closterium sp. NIES-67]